jgi:hypothetical protein
MTGGSVEQTHTQGMLKLSDRSSYRWGRQVKRAAGPDKTLTFRDLDENPHCFKLIHETSHFLSEPLFQIV